MRSPRLAIVMAGLLATLPSQAQTPDMPPQWTLPLAGFVNGSMAEIENAACCGASRGAPVRNGDAAVLATLPGRASRDGRLAKRERAGTRSLRLTSCGRPACA